MKAKGIISVVVFGLVIGTGVVYDLYRTSKVQKQNDDLLAMEGALYNTLEGYQSDLESYQDSLSQCRKWCDFYRERGDAYADMKRYGLGFISEQEMGAVVAAALYDTFIQNTTIVIRSDTTVFLNFSGQLFEVPVQLIK